MPPTSLRATLDSLANNFASAILEAIRSASLEQLLAESGGGRASSNGVRAKAAGGGGQPDPLKTPSRKPSGRLARRSPEEIAKTLGSIVSLLKGKKAGMRSEEIRKALKLDVREVPRVLKEGLSSKKLKSKGQKRATVYTAG
jgi:hypothetical protein